MSVPKSFAGLPPRDGSETSPIGHELRPTATAPSSHGEPWCSPEGIEIQPVYGPEHLEGLDALDT